jgi:hypothetical protein
MIWVVVPIPFGQHLYSHAEIARRLPYVGSGLHQPRRRGVAKNVGRYVVAEAGISHSLGKRLRDPLYGLAFPFYCEPLPLIFPTAYVGEKAIR